jgi:thiol-disulfide isomerase/thioredoxin
MTSTTSAPANPNRIRNLIVAIVAVILAIGFALALKTQNTGTSLGSMAKQSVPFDVAMQNGKPTMMEFYADWCSSCKAMTPTMAALKQEYGDRVNFVMLNVDNEKWLPEIVSYRVDGIPHWVYLNAAGAAQAQAIGELPKGVIAANLEALAIGEALPTTAGTGQTSAYKPPAAVQQTKKSQSDDPRAHGAQVKTS